MAKQTEEHEHAHDVSRQAHSHNHPQLASDRAFLNNAAGIRTVWLALGALALTSSLQIVILTVSGSVALLADALHNIGDGLNAIPLLIAFYLVRRGATRRFPYGFGKAEDLAGVLIVLSIAFSGVLILAESFQKLLYPQPVGNLGWLTVAGLVGFLGNEAVALLQIRVGKQIGSAALTADGLHARSDGLSSLAVVAAAVAAWLGYPRLDALIGLAIGLLVLFLSWDAAGRVWDRLMDAADPQLLAAAEEAVRTQAGSVTLRQLRLRWVGHELQAEVHIAVDAQRSVEQGHQAAEQVRHALFHHLPNLGDVLVHVDPQTVDGRDYHELTGHHRPILRPERKAERCL